MEVDPCALDTPGTPPEALAAPLSGFIRHLQSEKRHSARTCDNYQRDLQRLGLSEEELAGPTQGPVAIAGRTCPATTSAGMSPTSVKAALAAAALPAICLLFVASTSICSGKAWPGITRRWISGLRKPVAGCRKWPMLPRSTSCWK